MEFPREDELIRGGFAWHALLFFEQYESLTRGLSAHRRYEATATLCVLHPMLTNYVELGRHLGEKRSPVLDTVDVFVMRLLDDPEVVVARTFSKDEALTATEVLENLRHALSHPRMRNTSPPTTGYTTVRDGTGQINKMRFTRSPDVDSHGDRTKRTNSDPRVFTIEIPLRLLTELALELARAMAQPAVDYWDRSELVPVGH